MKKYLVFGILFFVLFSGWLMASVNSTVYIVFRYEDNSILAWDFVSDTLEIIEIPGIDGIQKIKVSPDGQTFYFNTVDIEYKKCELVAFDLKRKIITKRIQLDTFGMNHVSVIETDNTGKFIWLSGVHRTIIDGRPAYTESYIVILETKSFSVEHINTSDLSYSGITFSNNNKKAYLGVAAYLDNSQYLNTVDVYSTDNYAKLKSIVVGSEGSMPGRIVRGRGNYLIVDNRLSGELAKIDTLDDEVVFIKPGHPEISSYWDAGSSVSKKRLFTSHSSSTTNQIIGVYDLNSLEHITDIPLPYDSIFVPSLDVDHTGRYVIFGTSYWNWDESNEIWIKGKEILVFDAQTYEILHVLELSGEPVINVMFLDIVDRK